jgi:hypothetical protein
MVSMRRILERFLAFALSMFPRSSQFKCFLLLLHFVLKFAPPRYNGISTVTLKCIANEQGFFSMAYFRLSFSACRTLPFTRRLNFGAELDFLDAETIVAGLGIYPTVFCIQSY